MNVLLTAQAPGWLVSQHQCAQPAKVRSTPSQVLEGLVSTAQVVGSWKVCSLPQISCLQAHSLDWAGIHHLQPPKVAHPVLQRLAPDLLSVLCSTGSLITVLGLEAKSCSSSCPCACDAAGTCA